MIFMAERFLVQCLSKNTSVQTFDDLRFEIFHQKSFSLDLEKLPSTSSSIKFHIQMAYLQAYMWYHAPVDEIVDLAPEMYGYRTDESGDQLFPIICDETRIPECFPIPCTCIKCARANVCPCLCLWRAKDLTIRLNYRGTAC